MNEFHENREQGRLWRICRAGLSIWAECGVFTGCQVAPYSSAPVVVDKGAEGVPTFEYLKVGEK